MSLIGDSGPLTGGAAKAPPADLIIDGTDAGFMAEVSATIAESSAFGDLQAPIRRLCGLDTPIPYSPTLEKASVPQVDDIVREAAALVGEW